MWATGDLTMGVIMAVLLAQWYKDSKKEAARIDRQLDREERIAARRAAASAGQPFGYDEADHAATDEEDQ